MRIAANAGVLDEAGLLDCLIAVDEFDAKLLRLSIDHQRVASGDSIECVATGLFVKIGARDVDSRVRRVNRLRSELAHKLLSQTRCQYQVSGSQEPQGLAKFQRVFIAKVGD